MCTCTATILDVGADVVLDLTNLVEAVMVRAAGDGYVHVWIRGVGRWTPGFLIDHVQRHLDERVPIGTTARVFEGGSPTTASAKPSST